MCKSSTVKFQTKQDYINRIKGYNYAVAVAQSEDHGALHLDAHIFFVKIQEEQPDIITKVMTQLYIKAVLKE